MSPPRQSTYVEAVDFGGEGPGGGEWAVGALLPPQLANSNTDPTIEGGWVVIMAIWKAIAALFLHLRVVVGNTVGTPIRPCASMCTQAQHALSQGMQFHHWTSW